MNLNKFVLLSTATLTYILFSQLRIEYQVSSADINQQDENINKKRLLVQSNLMTTSCADQEDVISQPYNEDYKKAVDNMKNLRGDNKALEAMEKEQDWNSYLDSLPAVYVGLLIFAIVAFIIFIVQSMQIFCQSCISCFKRDTEKEPYANWSIGCSIVTAIVTTMVLFGFSIAGLQTNKTLIKSMNRGICQSLTMVNHLVYGIQDKKWQGVDNIETQLRNIGNELEKTYENYQDEFTGSEFLTDLNLLHTQIGSMEVLKSDVVTLPNPNRSSSTKDVQPDIIFILGTQSILDQTKVVGSLEWEFQTKSALETNLLLKLKDSAGVIKKEGLALKTQLSMSQQSVNEFKTKIQDFKSLVEKQMENSKTAGLFVYNAGNAIYGITIAFGLFGLLSITLILWCRLSFVKYGIYITWIIISVMSIISFIAAIIGYTQAVGLMENCEGIQLLATDSSQFDKLINFIGTRELKTCFFGDGNLSTQFLLEEQFRKINEVKNDLSNIDGKKQLFEQLLDARYIYYWQKELNSYISYAKEAVQISSANSFQKYDLPSQTLDELNSWSNYEYTPNDRRANAQFSLSCGAFSRDIIVYSQNLCPTGLSLCQNVQPISQQCCIPLEEDIYTSSFIQARMNLINSSCPNLNDYKGNYQKNFDSINKYVKQLKKILKTNVKQKIDKYQTDSNAYLAKINTLYSKINTTFRTRSSNLIGMVTDTQKGIQNILQCQFLGEDFKNMHQGLCRSYMVRMYNSSVILIVVSCFSLVAQIAYFFTTTRIVDYIERNRVQKFVESSQKHIIDPEKYRSHPLHDQSIIQNQSYLNQSELQPAILNDESMVYQEQQQQQLQQQPQEMELSNIPNTKLVKQGLLEDLQKQQNTNLYASKYKNNPLPAPQIIGGSNINGDKPLLYEPKFKQKTNPTHILSGQNSLNKNSDKQNNQQQKSGIYGNDIQNKVFNNNFNDNDDDDDDDDDLYEEGMNKMNQTNNSKFGIPVNNNVIR